MITHAIPSLINQSFGDPGLLIQFCNKKEIFLFDLGDISSLKLRQMINITHIFVTHTHMDHFFGFDKLLRICLGRNKALNLYGPPNFIKNIEGKLASYNWNLISNYKHNLKLYITEVYETYIIKCKYESKNRFLPGQKKITTIKNNIILSKNMLAVKTVTLNHGIPCLGFSLEIQSQVKIYSEKLKSMNLVPGSWIGQLKHCIQNNLGKQLLKVFNVDQKTIYINSDILEKITYKLPGQKITYVTDVGYTLSNKISILKLAYKSTHLFIEAAFASNKEEVAATKYHLTAKQAGKIARMSKSIQYTLFHHSPRYINNINHLKSEAKLEFEKNQ